MCFKKRTPLARSRDEAATSGDVLLRHRWRKVCSSLELLVVDEAQGRLQIAGVLASLGGFFAVLSIGLPEYVGISFGSAGLGMAYEERNAGCALDDSHLLTDVIQGACRLFSEDDCEHFRGRLAGDLKIHAVWCGVDFATIPRNLHVDAISLRELARLGQLLGLGNRERQENEEQTTHVHLILIE